MSITLKVINFIKSRRTTFNKRECRKLVRQNSPVIVDIGAYDGLDTLEWRKIYPEEIIYAIEPRPDAFTKLLLKSEVYSIKPFNLALGEFNGYAEFYISSGKSTQSSSLRKPKLHLDMHPDVNFDQYITVTVSRLDDWAKETGVSCIDILWMDTQGTELDILESGPEILASVKLIHMEVALCEMYESQSTYNEVRAFLEEAGFSVYKEFFGHPHNPGMGNVVFVRQR